MVFHLAEKKKNEDLRLRHSISDSSKGLVRGCEGGARIYRTFCTKDQVFGTARDYCYLKRTRHLK